MHHGPYIHACTLALQSAGIPASIAAVEQDPLYGELYATLDLDPDWISSTFGGLSGEEPDAVYALLWTECIGWNLGVADPAEPHPSRIRPRLPLTRQGAPEAAPTPDDLASEAHRWLTRPRSVLSGKLLLFGQPGDRQLAKTLATYT
ncbi:hypothetical protein ABZ714_30835 [Streptomyces sp. NPDC006798]|uniref:hypothetical protein n=1 Tax=Streptomyces sp. NPDC006798 TaxID=3155462 RepID=UPI00340A4D2E